MCEHMHHSNVSTLCLLCNDSTQWLPIATGSNTSPGFPHVLGGGGGGGGGELEAHTRGDWKVPQWSRF